MGRELRAANGQFAGSKAGEKPPTPTPRLFLANCATPTASKPSGTETVPSLAWPQADELEKVCAVAIAVSEGADTSTTIAESLGVVTRQGAYYATAAESLGITVRDGMHVPCRWRLTEFGAAILSKSGTARISLMFTAVAKHPAVQTYLDGGEDAVVEAATRQGMSTETGIRRARTAKAWLDRVTGGNSATLDDEMAQATPRAAAAAARLRTERARQEAAPRETCPNCFMEKTVTGACFC